MLPIHDLCAAAFCVLLSVVFYENNNNNNPANHNAELHFMPRMKLAGNPQRAPRRTDTRRQARHRCAGVLPQNEGTEANAHTPASHGPRRRVCVRHRRKYQKIPHSHILLILAPEDKSRSTDDYNRFVCAELPDKQKHPQLYETVAKNMIHGPCGVLNPHPVCMSDSNCTEKFPKDPCATTTSTGNGYPVYRRRNNGTTVTQHLGGGS